MEQRQSDEPNEDNKAPTPEPKPETRPADTQAQAASAKPSADKRNASPRPANQRNETPSGNEQRDATNRRNPNQRDNRQQGGRNGGQRDENPRNNRNDRDRGPQDAGTPERGPQDAGTPERGTTERRPNQRNDARPNDRDRNNNYRDRTIIERETDSRNFASQDDQPSANAGRANTEGESSGQEDRLIIGISLGDYNGIGPEVILKALQYNRLQKICTPVIYGSMRVLNRYRNLLNLKDWNLNGVPTIGQISHKMTNVITCWPDQNQDIQPGQVTPEAGQAALACLQRAVDDLKNGRIDALVTAPINKYNIQSEEFKFPGHTEYLAQEFGVQDNLMFLVSEKLRVGVVTGHVPLGRVRQNVTKERITEKLTLMMQSLKQDFGIEKPKIAVLGLNPHAGEEGLLGNEENDIIKPLIEEWRNKGQLVFGPYPADGFFGTRGYTKFDAVLAMYHDQGLIPFKAIAFEEGVNFTAGMPAVRTSPDHGTAYDIAGKDLADETSMLQAIYTAVDVARQRKEFQELEANALK